jgi:[Skp1-protein]-hydroxyproline N-acetylglucosaminyltransferase
MLQPGDGARFVKHTDTYATAHVKGRSNAGSGGAQLIRLVTCVYYLNPDWVPDHGGYLRVFTKDSPQQHWDAAPVLDTLVVFRSTDVEHEVLPTFHERMALTVWYYGPPPPAATKSQAPAAAALGSVPSLKPFLAPGTLSADTIFVAIPSYRDSECRHTVDDLIQKARNPSRISIGICLQCDHDDDTQTYLKSKYPSSQVRITRVDYRDAAGPCVARAIAQALYEHETYYLQIDSHMRFRDGWDDFLIEELKKCPSPKAILTTYPFGYTLPNLVSF